MRKTDQQQPDLRRGDARKPLPSQKGKSFGLHLSPEGAGFIKNKWTKAVSKLDGENTGVKTNRSCLVQNLSTLKERDKKNQQKGPSEENTT